MSAPDRNGLLPRFRMPAVLGPAPGPRNMPADWAHLLFHGQMDCVSFQVEADAEGLRAAIPKQCTLRAARLEVQVIRLLNLGWLAGRGYNIVAVRIPVTLHHAGVATDYSFTPVLWESAADPVLTGREELGSPKLYAEIPDYRRLDDTLAGHAAWDGFRFFEYSASGLAAAEPAFAVPVVPNLLYKYFPRTGLWGTADVAAFTVSVPGEHPPVRLVEREEGTGHFAFNRPRWEDMPTQFGFVDRLADIRCSDTARVLRTFTDGIADLRAQSTIDFPADLPCEPPST